MAYQSDVIFLDTNIIQTTYADLGIAGLEVYLDRADKLFVSEELRDELTDSLQDSSNLPVILDWFEALEEEGRAVDGIEITAEDRTRYNPTGKNDGNDGEKVDIAIRKYMDSQPAGTRFEVVSNDVGLLKNEVQGVKIVDVDFKPTTLEQEMMDRVEDKLLTPEEFETISSRNYQPTPGFAVQEDFPSQEEYEDSLEDTNNNVAPFTALTQDEIDLLNNNPGLEIPDEPIDLVIGGGYVPIPDGEEDNNTIGDSTPLESDIISIHTGDGYPILEITIEDLIIGGGYGSPVNSGFETIILSGGASILNGNQLLLQGMTVSEIDLDTLAEILPSAPEILYGENGGAFLAPDDGNGPSVAELLLVILAAATDGGSTIVIKGGQLFINAGRALAPHIAEALAYIGVASLTVGAANGETGEIVTNGSVMLSDENLASLFPEAETGLAGINYVTETEDGIQITSVSSGSNGELNTQTSDIYGNIISTSTSVNGETTTITYDPGNENLWNSTATITDANGNVTSYDVTYDDLAGQFQDAPDLTLFDVSAFDEDSAAYFTDGLVSTIPENMSVVAADINGVPTYDLVSNSFTLVADEVAYTSLSASYWQQALGPVDWGLYGSELVYSLDQLEQLQEDLVWNTEQQAFTAYDAAGYDSSGLDIDGHDGYWSAGTSNNSSGIGATYTNSDGSTISFGLADASDFLIMHDNDNTPSDELWQQAA